MKTHKITEFNILPDRRVASWDLTIPIPESLKGVKGIDDQRTNKFTYPSDKLIIEVPLDPQPEPVKGRFQYFKDYFVFKPWDVDEHLLHEQIFIYPYQKDDILALGGPWYKWVNVTSDHVTVSLKPPTGMDVLRHEVTRQPASTCPIEICRKVKVVRVIDVQERKELALEGTIEEYSFSKGWHSIILVEEI